MDTEEPGNSNGHRVWEGDWVKVLDASVWVTLLFLLGMVRQYSSCRRKVMGRRHNMQNTYIKNIKVL